MTRMKILGAKVVPVTHGNKTLKEAVDSAFESYAKNYKDSIYCIGSAKLSPILPRGQGLEVHIVVRPKTSLRK